MQVEAGNPSVESWIDDNRASFAEVNNRAGLVEDVNRSYDELIVSNQIVTSEIRDIVVDHLKAKQTNDFQNLLEVASLAPYDGLAERERQLRDAIGIATMKLAMIEGRRQELRDIVRADKELVLKRLPELATKIGEMALTSGDSQLDAEYNFLQEALQAAQSEYDQFVDFYHEEAGKAWPIPTLVAPEQRQPGIENITTSNVIDVDEFPVGYEGRTNQEIAESVRRRHGFDCLRNASEFTALLLAEEPRRIFAVNELRDLVYGNDRPIRNDSRIAALMHQYKVGNTMIIGDVLHREGGLVLQRGVRESISLKTGQKLGSSKVVYRAVPADEAEICEMIIHTTGGDRVIQSGWQIIGAQAEEGIEEAGIVEASVAPKEIQPFPLKAVVAKEIPKMTRTDWEKGFRRDLEKVIDQSHLDHGTSDKKLGLHVGRAKSRGRVRQFVREAKDTFSDSSLDEHR